MKEKKIIHVYILLVQKKKKNILNQPIQYFGNFDFNLTGA